MALHTHGHTHTKPTQKTLKLICRENAEEQGGQSEHTDPRSTQKTESVETHAPTHPLSHFLPAELWYGGKVRQRATAGADGRGVGEGGAGQKPEHSWRPAGLFKAPLPRRSSFANQRTGFYADFLHKEIAYECSTLITRIYCIGMTFNKPFNIPLRCTHRGVDFIFTTSWILCNSSNKNMGLWSDKYRFLSLGIFEIVSMTDLLTPVFRK